VPNFDKLIMIITHLSQATQIVHKKIQAQFIEVYYFLSFQLRLDFDSFTITGPSTSTTTTGTIHILRI
jgi:hypothetical protein